MINVTLLLVVTNNQCIPTITQIAICIFLSYIIIKTLLSIRQAILIRRVNENIIFILNLCYVNFFTINKRFIFQGLI